VPIQISVYADKIYIANSGALMEDPGYSYSAIAMRKFRVLSCIFYENDLDYLYKNHLKKG